MIFAKELPSFYAGLTVKLPTKSVDKSVNNRFLTVLNNGFY